MSKRKIEILEKAGGNTNLQLASKKQVTQSKFWCFTWNNFPNRAKETMIEVFKKNNMEYIIGEEVGDSGTPHLQGYCEAASRMRWSELKLPKEIHWEKRKGTRSQNVKYCSKEGKYVCTAALKPPRELKLIDPTYDWEQTILKEIQSEPDDRTIHWIWSNEGNMGKTSFCKYLVAKHNAAVLHRKGDNIRHGLAEWIKDKDAFPDLVVYPIPRCFETQYLSYEGLENIKDMFFYSGKYEGGQVCGPPPHLYVFANVEPNYAKMSLDRWHVVCIDKN